MPCIDGRHLVEKNFLNLHMIAVVEYPEIEMFSCLTSRLKMAFDSTLPSMVDLCLIPGGGKNISSYSFRIQCFFFPLYPLKPLKVYTLYRRVKESDFLLLLLVTVNHLLYLSLFLSSFPVLKLFHDYFMNTPREKFVRYFRLALYQGAPIYFKLIHKLI